MPDPEEHRPFSEEQRGEVCAVLGLGCGRATAAKRIGREEVELYEEASRNPEFAAEMRQAESAYELRHMKNVYEAASDPKNWRVSVWALEHVLPERYARRDPGRINASQAVKIVGMVADILVEEVTDEAIRESIQRRIGSLLDEFRHDRLRKGM